MTTTLYEEFAEEEVARGRALPGLFPVAGDEAKRDFEVWKKARSGGSTLPQQSKPGSALIASLLPVMAALGPRAKSAEALLPNY